MKTLVAITSAAFLVALTACSTGEGTEAAEPQPTVTVTAEASPEPQPTVTETVTAEPEIPEDAPIWDMESEDDLMREMLGCEDSETLEECEQRYGEETVTELVAYDVEVCAENIEAGISLMPCFTSVLPYGAFYAHYEEETGSAVPEEFKPEDLTAECEAMGAEWYELAEYGTEADYPRLDELEFALETECGEGPA